ncbi:TPA: hypothetical protein QCP98_002146 [Bacillus cereus]|uniref:hypothetical protein n=1 Tax=Bacillus thuringiensis TaxID=1428 RepID=UPI000BFE1059|nr:hypothetical protein [Bacillus thuringiensis]PGP44871.1 hypothetical protein COA06_18420 [Bacillus thuringiensis]PGR48650.1 hypothetical protein COC57_10390 [Bacillus thuringiensis]HDR4461386.1 hypothetical protein [Bacillus cereus]
MVFTLHTGVINSFLEQGREEIQVQITVEEIDNTILKKKLINQISRKMDVNVFAAILEELIDNLEKDFPSASIKVIDENKSSTLNEDSNNMFVSMGFIVKFKFLYT